MIIKKWKLLLNKIDRINCLISRYAGILNLNWIHTFRINIEAFENIEKLVSFVDY